MEHLSNHVICENKRNRYKEVLNKAALDKSKEIVAEEMCIRDSISVKFVTFLLFIFLGNSRMDFFYKQKYYGLKMCIRDRL